MYADAIATANGADKSDHMDPARSSNQPALAVRWPALTLRPAAAIVAFTHTLFDSPIYDIRRPLTHTHMNW